MIKKLYTALAALMLMTSAAATAQEVGSWTIFPVFSGNNNTKLIDTDSEVFYLADNWLYSYKKDADESVYYTKSNGLNDTQISSIYYNYDKNCLFVVYSNSNIDIIRSNGRIDNVPDLKNVVLTVSKTINDVNFDGDYAYVATDFGYMVVDCEKCIVKESFNYGKAFTSIVTAGDNIYASFDKKVWVSGKNAAHYEISSFTQTSITQSAKLYKRDDNSFLLQTGWLYLATIGSDPAKLTMTTVGNSSPSNVSRSGDNLIASYKDKFVTVLADGTLQTTTAPEGTNTALLSSVDGKGLWNLDSDGLKEFSITDGSVTVLHEAYLPNTTTVGEPYYFQYTNGTLYSMNSGVNYKEGTSRLKAALCKYTDSKWTNLMPTKMTTNNSSSGGVMKSPYAVKVDPNNPDRIWFGSYFEGISCVENGKQIQKIDQLNSPIYLNYVCCVSGLDFDAEGNLWFAFYNYNKTSYAAVYVLPKAKLYNETLTADDFISIDLGTFATTYENELFVTSNGRYVLVANNMWKTYLAIIDNNGTPLDTSDDTKRIITSFIDQDGKTIDVGYILSIAEDADGKIWLGTNNGVCVINSIQSLANGTSSTVNRVKVPRNDGTNLADYLLDGILVSQIAVDGANRKWCGTTTSGLYLVSSDGSEIIEHFTTDNSQLTSDLITGVCCSTDDNRVFIGTKRGTLVYESDATPSKQDYSNVYAYPNPVRPDYSGSITIAGLMENSLVKIADAMGNVLYSGRSTGGMFTWDGCNSDGSRVNTGVYYVFASQNENGSASGCVTKILVVK